MAGETEESIDIIREPLRHDFYQAYKKGNAVLPIALEALLIYVGQTFLNSDVSITDIGTWILSEEQLDDIGRSMDNAHLMFNVPHFTEDKAEVLPESEWYYPVSNGRLQDIWELTITNLSWVIASTLGAAGFIDDELALQLDNVIIDDLLPRIPDFRQELLTQFNLAAEFLSRGNGARLAHLYRTSLSPDGSLPADMIHPITQIGNEVRALGMAYSTIHPDIIAVMYDTIFDNRGLDEI